MDTKSVLMELSCTSGVSGYENPVFSVIEKILKKSGVKEEMISYSGGNLIADFGTRCKDKFHVLIDAHVDEIGFVVTYIDENGFIVPGNVGGMDFRLLPAQKVTVHGKSDITGVVCTLPPHLSSGSEAINGMGSVRIDTGYSAEKLSEIVTPGDTISFGSAAYPLLGGRVTGKSLDNRAGAAALLNIAEIFCKEDIENCSFSLLFSSSEEIGERGAKTACFKISPDIAVAVDVSFAYSLSERRQDCGLLSEGPMIGVSPSLSREVTDMLIDAASSAGIKYQIEVMPELSGTNADQFSVSGCGVKSCTCSIPLRYMHTPAEVADVSDIEMTAGLLAEFLRRI